MANNPKKVKDPTEVALSAIQEALNISDAPPVDDARGSLHSDVTPTSSQDYSEGAFNFDEGTFDTRSSTDRPTFEPVEEPRAIRRAAASVPSQTITAPACCENPMPTPPP